jgi:hypothetical protein
MPSHVFGGHLGYYISDGLRCESREIKIREYTSRFRGGRLLIFGDHAVHADAVRRPDQVRVVMEVLAPAF